MSKICIIVIFQYSCLLFCVAVVHLINCILLTILAIIIVDVMVAELFIALAKIPISITFTILLTSIILVLNYYNTNYYAILVTPFQFHCLMCFTFRTYKDYIHLLLFIYYCAFLLLCRGQLFTIFPLLFFHNSFIITWGTDAFGTCVQQTQ